MRIYSGCGGFSWVGIVMLALSMPAISSADQRTSSSNLNAPFFQDLSQVQWEKMLPELGETSPEIAILHIEPTTNATQLLIRSPRALHVRKHWHSANETHTMIIGKATFGCEGHKVELGPGGFNYMPARMVHEAWTTPGSSDHWDNRLSQHPGRSSDRWWALSNHQAVRILAFCV
jgi:quercetin dioxygenase-like cupin family protein